MAREARAGAMPLATLAVSSHNDMGSAVNLRHQIVVNRFFDEKTRSELAAAWLRGWDRERELALCTSER